MEILKKPYKKSPKAKKYSGAKWPHERAQIALKEANEAKKKGKEFKKRDYNKERAAKMREWKEWF